MTDTQTKHSFKAAIPKSKQCDKMLDLITNEDLNTNISIKNSPGSFASSISTHFGSDSEPVTHADSFRNKRSFSLSQFSSASLDCSPVAEDDVRYFATLLEGEELNSPRTPIPLRPLDALNNGLSAHALSPEMISIRNVTRLGGDQSEFNTFKLNLSPADELITSWADVEITDDESSDMAESADISDKNDLGVFRATWGAWYDPPRGKTGRLGISEEAYAKNLFKMGDVSSMDDLWTVQFLIDWENLPLDCTLSFCRLDSKPYWEDPSNADGGRWVVKGFPRNRSEDIFMRLAHCLAVDYLPNNDDVNCISLQVKSNRRGNSLLIWSRCYQESHGNELIQFIECLAEEMTDTKKKKRRRRSKAAASSNLSIAFLPNRDSIERNAEKLGYCGTRRSKLTSNCGSFNDHADMIDRCDKVSQLYSMGVKGKRRKNPDLNSTIAKALLESKLTPALSSRTRGSSETNISACSNPVESTHLNSKNSKHSRNKKRQLVFQSDVETSLNDEDLVFVEYKPEMFGWTSQGYYDKKGCWYPEAPACTLDSKPIETGSFQQYAYSIPSI